jgi:hypothetical protein
VDRDIYPAQCLYRSSHNSLGGAWQSQIGGKQRCIQSQRLQFRLGARSEKHIIAASRKQAGEFGTDSTRGTRDKNI